MTMIHTTSGQVLTLNQEELESYILEAMDRWKVPGLSIAIVKDGETVLAKGYGTCEVDKHQPVDEHTLFAISHGTTSFTASALAILVSEKKMAWNDRLIDLLPGFKTGSDLVTHHATVIDALANRTGLPGDPLSCLPHPNLSRTELLGKIKYIQPSSDFRSQWGGDYLLTVAAGEIIPELTSISWDYFVRDRLFAPVGMKDSITGPHLFGDNQNIATPHETEEGNVIPVRHAQTSNIGPAISMYSSAVDMARWLTFQLNNGKVGDEIIIPKEQMEVMRASHIAANFNFPGIAKNFLNQGLGLFISDSSMGYKLYSNGGGTEGTEAYHAFVPELNLGVAVMTNCGVALPQRLIPWIIDRYTGAPEKDWVNDILPVFEKQHETFFSDLAISREKITDHSKRPSQDIGSYTGLYQHPLLGDLVVELVSEKLTFTLGSSYLGNLIHANHDTFFIDVSTPHVGKFLFKGSAQFRLDPTGQISSLMVMDREFQKVGASL